jgi:hypothetical protein
VGPSGALFACSEVLILAIFLLIFCMPGGARVTTGTRTRAVFEIMTSQKFECIRKGIIQRVLAVEFSVESLVLRKILPTTAHPSGRGGVGPLGTGACEQLQGRVVSKNTRHEAYSAKLVLHDWLHFTITRAERRSANNLIQSEMQPIRLVSRGF